MSVEQVKGAFPQVAKPATAEKWGNGAEELLRLESQKIAGVLFDVGFIFENGALLQVTLTVKEKGAVSSAAYSSLYKSLCFKYGTPLVSKERNAVGLESIWVSGRININMLLVDTLSPAILRIVYQTQLAEGADGL